MWGVSAGPAAADENREAQWALKNYGAASRVWPISQGDGVIVAVIDSGVNADHPDLAGQVLPGLDLTGGGGDGRTDTDGHGTGMASNIAAHGHGDNAGVMGLAPKAKILPIKIELQQSGGFDTKGNTDVSKGIRFAVDHGAKVINMSIGGGSTTDTGLREAVDYAVKKDVVLVASSGNTPGLAVEFPAGYAGVVAVSGVVESGDVWPKSTTGPQVTLAAPAEKIRHASRGQGYAEGTGTSDATSFVSAIAALVRSKYPNLSAGQVINRMIKSAVQPDGKGPFPNDKYGYGIATPAGALAANPAVDNGPKENPLLNRAEPNGNMPGGSATASTPAQAPPSGGSTAPQASSDSGSGSGMLIGIGGAVLAVLVVVLIIVLVRRSKNGGGGGSGGPGGPGGPAGPGGGPGGPAYGYAPPQQPGAYGQQQPYPPQGQYQPQQPPPAGGNPYQR
ncbi:type VII secretion-associated serine protease mycosin [Streptomyces sp. TLI_171]|nr:type VII secretion-associated serine protease mycosin [Streptomyces sp. TLI_171]